MNKRIGLTLVFGLATVAVSTAASLFATSCSGDKTGQKTIHITSLQSTSGDEKLLSFNSGFEFDVHTKDGTIIGIEIPTFGEREIGMSDLNLVNLPAVLERVDGGKYSFAKISPLPDGEDDEDHTAYDELISNSPVYDFLKELMPQEIGMQYDAGVNVSGKLSLPDVAERVPAYFFSATKESGQAFNWQAAFDLVLPKGIKTIGKEAFQDSKNIRDVEFPESLEHIEESAFSRCSEMKQEIAFPKNLKKIDAYAFFENTFASINFGDYNDQDPWWSEDENVLHVGKSAFETSFHPELLDELAITSADSDIGGNQPAFQHQPASQNWPEEGISVNVGNHPYFFEDYAFWHSDRPYYKAYASYEPNHNLPTDGTTLATRAFNKDEWTTLHPAAWEEVQNNGWAEVPKKSHLLWKPSLITKIFKEIVISCTRTIFYTQSTVQSDYQDNDYKNALKLFDLEYIPSASSSVDTIPYTSFYNYKRLQKWDTEKFGNQPWVDGAPKETIDKAACVAVLKGELETCIGEDNHTVHNGPKYTGPRYYWIPYLETGKATFNSSVSTPINEKGNVIKIPYEYRVLYNELSAIKPTNVERYSATYIDNFFDKDPYLSLVSSGSLDKKPQNFAYYCRNQSENSPAVDGYFIDYITPTLAMPISIGTGEGNSHDLFYNENNVEWIDEEQRKPDYAYISSAFSLTIGPTQSTMNPTNYGDVQYTDGYDRYGNGEETEKTLLPQLTFSAKFLDPYTGNVPLESDTGGTEGNNVYVNPVNYIDLPDVTQVYGQYPEGTIPPPSVFDTVSYPAPKDDPLTIFTRMQVFKFPIGDTVIEMALFIYDLRINFNSPRLANVYDKYKFAIDQSTAFTLDVNTKNSPDANAEYYNVSGTQNFVLHAMNETEEELKTMPIGYVNAGTSLARNGGIVNNFKLDPNTSSINGSNVGYTPAVEQVNADKYKTVSKYNETVSRTSYTAIYANPYVVSQAAVDAYYATPGLEEVRDKNGYPVTPIAIPVQRVLTTYTSRAGSEKIDRYLENNAITAYSYAVNLASSCPTGDYELDLKIVPIHDTSKTTERIIPVTITGKNITSSNQTLNGDNTPGITDAAHGYKVYDTNDFTKAVPNKVWSTTTTTTTTKEDSDRFPKLDSMSVSSLFGQTSFILNTDHPKDYTINQISTSLSNQLSSNTIHYFLQDYCYNAQNQEINRVWVDGDGNWINPDGVRIDANENLCDNDPTRWQKNWITYDREQMRLKYDLTNWDALYPPIIGQKDGQPELRWTVAYHTIKVVAFLINYEYVENKDQSGRITSETLKWCKPIQKETISYTYRIMDDASIPNIDYYDSDIVQGIKDGKITGLVDPTEQPKEKNWLVNNDGALEYKNGAYEINISRMKKYYDYLINVAKEGVTEAVKHASFYIPVPMLVTANFLNFGFSAGQQPVYRYFLPKQNGATTYDTSPHIQIFNPTVGAELNGINYEQAQQNSLINNYFDKDYDFTKATDDPANYGKVKSIPIKDLWEDMAGGTDSSYFKNGFGTKRMGILMITPMAPNTEKTYHIGVSVRNNDYATIQAKDVLQVNVRTYYDRTFADFPWMWILIASAVAVGLAVSYATSFGIAAHRNKKMKGVK